MPVGAQVTVPVEAHVMAEVPTKVTVLVPVEAQVAVSVEAQVMSEVPIKAGVRDGGVGPSIAWKYTFFVLIAGRSAPLSIGMTAGPLARHNQATLPPCTGDEVGDGVGALGVQSFYPCRYSQGTCEKLWHRRLQPSLRIPQRQRSFRRLHVGVVDE
jgi:hypothetical protein